MSDSEYPTQKCPSYKYVDPQSIRVVENEGGHLICRMQAEHEEEGDPHVWWLEFDRRADDPHGSMGVYLQKAVRQGRRGKHPAYGAAGRHHGGAVCGPRVSDHYYYFAFASEEAEISANERILARIELIKATGRNKPHHLVVANLGGQSIRWLTLSVGTFECTNDTIVTPTGQRVSGPAYGFDKAGEDEAAARRVRNCPEFQPEIALFHESRLGGNLAIQPLTEEAHNEPA